MMNQDTVVLIIVGICVALVLWGTVRRMRGKKSGCGCSDGSGRRSGGCSGCRSDHCCDK